MYRVASGLGALKVSRPCMEPYPRHDLLGSFHFRYIWARFADPQRRRETADPCFRELPVVRTRAGLMREPGS